jgi:hypothetical protein
MDPAGAQPPHNYAVVTFGHKKPHSKVVMDTFGTMAGVVDCRCLQDLRQHVGGMNGRDDDHVKRAVLEQAGVEELIAQAPLLTLNMLTPHGHESTNAHTTTTHRQETHKTQHAQHKTHTHTYTTTSYILRRLSIVDSPLSSSAANFDCERT